MDGPTLKGLPPFTTIGHRERVNVLRSLNRPLSGYLGGRPTGGYWVERLAEQWAALFNCKYAIPCNSATSGLLAACMATGIGPGDEVWTTPFSMSATAACAKVLGAKVSFIDIERMRYGIDPALLDRNTIPKALIVTNLFGHPAYLSVLRSWAKMHGVVMIEDNAQAIFAQEYEKYTGTIGHMGVFSLNVHKHLQCGEGGIICTDNGEFSLRLRHAINHGELSGSTPQWVGLNLRMTEPIAAIACAQLGRAEEIIRGRRRLAHALTDMMRDIPWLNPPVEDIGCKHSYYVWAGTVDDPIKRQKFVSELNLRGFPMREGYTRPLNHVFRSSDLTPVTDRVNEALVTFEVCAHDPKAHHLEKMKDIMAYVVEGIDGNRGT